MKIESAVQKIVGKLVTRVGDLEAKLSLLNRVVVRLQDEAAAAPVDEAVPEVDSPIYLWGGSDTDCGTHWFFNTDTQDWDLSVSASKMSLVIMSLGDFFCEVNPGTDGPFSKSKPPVLVETLPPWARA